MADAQAQPGSAPEQTRPKDGETAAAATGGPSVRFSSQNEEIEPDHSLQTVETLTQDRPEGEHISPEEQEEIRKISRSLHAEGHLQKRRMSNFVFEPVSLPASRVPSNDTPSERAGSVSSSLHKPSVGSIHTPPLTPAGSTGREPPKPSPLAPAAEMTPQTSAPHDVSATTSNTTSGTDRPSSSGASTTRPTTVSSTGGADQKPRTVPIFAAGPDSSAASRDSSPSRRSGAPSGTTTPPGSFSRPFTPANDRDDPYSRSRRPPQSKNLDQIDARFVFEGRDSRRSSAVVSPAPASPSRSGSTADAGTQPRQGSLAQHHHHQKRGSGQFDEAHKHTGSMADLKRFLHIGGHKKHHSAQPAAAKAAATSKSGASTPDQSAASGVPFADDHGLQSRYGKFGKVLGSGAGGSVRLMKRPSDGVTFAVKQFREKHGYETEKEYAKKVTAEFCIGSTLHHGNIIETMDIIQERGRWYEVMEYAPYDLFAIVMTGKMTREEVACSFLQIVAGVTYLHSMGLAHRDLKLDNVVVNEHGIMKIIDFGSATVYRYPLENDIVLATGVVGSDPYLAPEVYDTPRYDPQPCDIWSLAIIFACMSLRRFPWRAPRLTDSSYKLFVAPPSPGTPTVEALKRRSVAPTGDDKASVSSHHHQRQATDGSASPSTTNGSAATAATGSAAKGDAKQQEVIKGPWRLLRLLPRESRNIMSRMLEVDPQRRATLADMLDDPWVAGAPVCRQIDHGEIIKATGHTHTLVHGEAPQEPSNPSKK